MFSKKIKMTLKIEGMKCIHCSEKVKKALQNIEGVKKVKVDLEKGCASFKSEDVIDRELLEKTIEDLGYKVISIEVEQ